MPSIYELRNKSIGTGLAYQRTRQLSRRTELKSNETTLHISMSRINYGIIALRLLILTILISITSSETCSNIDSSETFKQDVTRSLAAGSQSVLEFKEKIKDKDVVIFLGSTKGGKSTVANYLIGTKLEAYYHGLQRFKIKEQEHSGGPKIGHTSLSVTTVPGVYPISSKSNMVVVDCPGFDDNRGPVQNVINALFINQIKFARAVKFVMVADIQEVANDNVNVFIDSLQQMHELLHSSYDASPTSTSIIFTKVPSSWTVQDISDLLRRQILNDNLKVNKLLVTNIINNPRLIGIFRAPSKEGEITPDFGVNILGAIEESEAVSMKHSKVAFTLSEEARAAILEIYPEYIDSNYFKKEVDDIIKGYRNYFQDKWIYASFDEELNSTKVDLKAKQLLVQAHRNAHRAHLYDIQKSLNTLQGSPTSPDFTCSFNFIILFEQSSIIDKHYQSIIEENYSNSLQQLLDEINQILKSINVELQERENNYIQFPAVRSFRATAETLAYGMVHKSYDAAKGVYTATADTASNVIQAIPEKELLPQALHAALNLADEKLRKTTLEYVCMAAENAAEIAIAYAPKALTVTGIAGVLGTGGASYILYDEIYGKRFEARKAQGRKTYSWL